jgi:sugar O-acyltransferase (sialic acid O-acetyltransferase NeuD family)
MRKSLAIIGAGALGIEVMELADEASFYNKGLVMKYSEKFFVDSNKVSLSKFRSDEEFLMSAVNPNYLIAVASPTRREQISKKYRSAGATAISAISKRAHVSSLATIGIGSIVQKFSTISSNTIVGEFLITNFHAYIGHDCRIGHFVTISPGVSIGGNVHIADSVFIGAGATIKNGTIQNPLKIGDSAVIGMGAVVTKDVPAFSVVVGNPARYI